MVLLFGTFARISTALSIFGFSIFLGIPVINEFEDQTWIFTANGGLMDIFAMIIWSGMSIYGIKASLTIAQAVVSGMGAGLAAPK